MGRQKGLRESRRVCVKEGKDGDVDDGSRNGVAVGRRSM